MGKYYAGARVIYTDGRGNKSRGRVTSVEGSRRRIVSDTGNRSTVHVRKIVKNSPDKVLILEGRLDRNLKSDRIYGPTFNTLLQAYGVTTLYEKVHCLKDLRDFLRKEGAHVDTRVIHIMCHGCDMPGTRKAQLQLTHEKVGIMDNIDIFKGLKGKIIIFSCCEIGNDRSLLEEIKKVSSAAAVIAYRKEVYDTFTNLAEIMLYDRLMYSHNKPQKIVTQVQEVLQMLGTASCDEVTRKSVLVCA